ncbi:MAG: PorP/SprF family type IX secretion system membrane protein [Flavobacteriales bacterium]|nr:PorP/SprF family type IX secretion system membrane protein [Flavobacteriales bacterium]
MKFKTGRLIVCSVLSLYLMLGNYAFAQDPQFSQFYNAPLYLNPAFTGNTIQGRVGGNYRKQWQGIPGAFTSYSFFYDQNLPKIQSGVGLLVVRDKAGSVGLRYTKIGGLYSYKLALTRTLFVNAGVRASYAAHTMDFSFLKFGDQLLRDDPFSSVETFTTRNISYFDLSTGFIVYGGRFWLGASFDHLTRPSYSFMGSDAKLPIKYSVHGGYIVPVQRSAKGATVRNLMIAANYKAQLDWDQFDIGAYYKLYSYVLGIWYRGIPGLKAYQPGYSNHDAVILSIGYQVQDYFNIGYSYDITISKLGLVSKGSHEVAIIYEFAKAEYKRGAKKKMIMVPCAKFTDNAYGISPAKKKKKKKKK